MTADPLCTHGHARGATRTGSARGGDRAKKEPRTDVGESDVIYKDINQREGRAALRIRGTRYPEPPRGSRLSLSFQLNFLYLLFAPETPLRSCLCIFALYIRAACNCVRVCTDVLANQRVLAFALEQTYTRTKGHASVQETGLPRVRV